MGLKTGLSDGVTTQSGVWFPSLHKLAALQQTENDFHVVTSHYDIVYCHVTSATHALEVAGILHYVNTSEQHRAAST
jgi:hypothetical protein